MSDYDEIQHRRDDEERERQHAAREARERRNAAEAQLEIREFRGASGPVGGPVGDALADWLRAMDANRWGYAPLPAARPAQTEYEPTNRGTAAFDEWEAA